MASRGGRWPSRDQLEDFAKANKGNPAFPKRMSRGSLQRWKDLYFAADKDPVALLNQPHPTGSRLDKDVLSIIQDNINADYLRPNPHKAVAIHRSSRTTSAPRMRVARRRAGRQRNGLSRYPRRRSPA